MNVPMLLVGDFNLSEKDRNQLMEYRKYPDLELKSDPTEQTTHSDNCIVLNLSRYKHLTINVTSFPCIQ